MRADSCNSDDNKPNLSPTRYPVRVNSLTPAFLAIAALSFCAAPARAARPQQSSQTPQPQQGDSSQPAAPNQGSPQDGPLPPPPAPDKPSAQQPSRPANNDAPQWSTSKRDDSDSGDADDSASDSNSKAKQKKQKPQYTDDNSDSNDSSDSSDRPKTSKAKAGVLPPETDPAWDPFHAAQDIDVGKFYMDKGDYDAAITRFEDAIRLQANFAKPRALIAEAYEKKGDKEQALHYYQEYLKVLPNAADAKKIQKKIAQLQSK